MTEFSKGNSRQSLHSSERRSFFYAFHSFSMRFLTGCLILAAICAFVQMGYIQGHVVTAQIIWLLIAAGMTAALAAARRLMYQPAAERIIRERQDAVTAETLCACLLLLAGFMLRLAAINRLSVEPSSDYATYYGIADVLNRGAMMEEGGWYREYISLFPHVLGYPAVLSLVFRVFGTGVRTAQIFNLLLQTVSCFFVWRIARRLSGRISGLYALAFAAFFPSTILYSPIVASEPLFTCLLLSAVWLFIRLIQPERLRQAHPRRFLSGLILLGLILAFASFIRPMGIIFLIAAVITILTLREKDPDDEKNKKTAANRLTDRRWKLCLILAAAWFAGSSLFSAVTANTIQREPAGASVSFGFNLMVGVKQESFGAWNAEDAAFLDVAMKETGSASDAQKACRDRAFERLKTGLTGLPALTVAKFAILWGCDNYGSFWTGNFLEEQGKMTPESRAFLDCMYDISDMFYLFVLLCAVCSLFSRLRGKPDAGYAVILLLCGTIALHLIVETQNRYHYYALYLLAAISGDGLRAIIRKAEGLMTGRMKARGAQATQPEKRP